MRCCMKSKGFCGFLVEKNEWKSFGLVINHFEVSTHSKELMRTNIGSCRHSLVLKTMSKGSHELNVIPLQLIPFKNYDKSRNFQS